MRPQHDAAYKFSAWWSSNEFQVFQADVMYEFLAWWSSNVFQVEEIYKFLAWCSKVSSLVTGSHIWRHLWWSSRWPDMLLPFLNGAILNWNDSSFSQKPFTFTLPSNWVLSGEGVIPRVINSRQRWGSCWGRRQVCKIQKQSQTGRSTMTITQGMNMIEVIKNVVEKCQLWWSGISGIGAYLGSRLPRQQGMPHYFAKGG